MTVTFSTVGVLKELSADERTRMMAEDREKFRRDMASRVDGARKEGREEGHKDILELLKSGKSPEEIIREYGEKRVTVTFLKNKTTENTEYNTEDTEERRSPS